MQKLLFSIENISKTIKNKNNIKINKFDFKKLKKESFILCKVLKEKIFLKEKIYLFEKIHENFLKSFRDNLSDFIGFNNITIRILESTLDVYKNHIIKFKLPITLNIIELLTNQDHGIIILSYELVSTIIEYLFGGDSSFTCQSIKNKKFTKIELGIIKKIINVIILSYNKIFQNIFTTSIKHVCSENIVDNQKHFLSFNNKIFLFTVFKISFNKIHHGIFRICIPLKVINNLQISEVYLSQHKYINFFKKKHNTILENNIYHCNVMLNVKLLDNIINLSYIIKLKKGDILPLSKPEKAVIYIDNFPIFKGIYNTINKKNAICINSIINFKEELRVNQNDIPTDKDKILKNNKIDLPCISKQGPEISNVKCKDKNQILHSDTQSRKLKDISRIFNIPVKVTVKLGQIKIKIKNLLEISEGTVLVLDKTIGEPLEIFINQSLIAKGEMVMVENQYGIRITTVVDASKCIHDFSL